MTHTHTQPFLRCLLVSLITFMFSGCDSVNNPTDDISTDTSTGTSTDTLPPDRAEDSGSDTDTASNTGTDTDSDTHVVTDSDTHAGTDAGIGNDSETDQIGPTDTATGTDATDIDSSEAQDVIWAYTFDSDMEGFYSDDSRVNATWTHNPDEGTLELVFEYEDARDMTHLEQLLHKWSDEAGMMIGEDWRAASEIVYTIRVNEAEKVGIQPFIQTGNWEWCAQWFVLVNDGAFHEYSLNLALLDGTEGPEGDIIDISDVNSIGIEVNAGPPADISAPMPTIEPGTIRLSIDSIVVKK